MWVRFPPLLPLTVYKYSVIIVLCPGDGIGIRVGLRSQILRVRVSPWAPYLKEDDMSKGSRARPFSIPLDELDARHEAIFGVKPKKEPYVPPPLPDDFYKEDKKKIDWTSNDTQS
jgi:hypothetical protein